MIDPQLAAFLQSGIAVHVGTRNHRLEPNGARAIAVAIDGDGVHMTVYVPEVASASVLADLHDNGQAAVCFARPVDDRSVQVKGTLVGADAASEANRLAVATQWQGFLDSLAVIGIPGESTRPWIAWPCVAIRLRVTAVFQQTPGPDAGAQLS